MNKTYCSMCGAPGVNKSSCPYNQMAGKVKPRKHNKLSQMGGNVDTLNTLTYNISWEAQSGNYLNRRDGTYICLNGAANEGPEVCNQNIARVVDSVARDKGGLDVVNFQEATNWEDIRNYSNVLTNLTPINHREDLGGGAFAEVTTFFNKNKLGVPVAAYTGNITNRGRPILLLDFPNHVVINLHFPHGGECNRKVDRGVDCQDTGKVIEYYLQKFNPGVDFQRMFQNKTVILTGDFNNHMKDYKETGLELFGKKLYRSKDNFTTCCYGLHTQGNPPRRASYVPPTDCEQRREMCFDHIFYSESVPNTQVVTSLDGVSLFEYTSDHLPLVATLTSLVQAKPLIKSGIDIPFPQPFSGGEPNYDMIDTGILRNLLLMILEFDNSKDPKLAKLLQYLNQQFPNLMEKYDELKMFAGTTKPKIYSEEALIREVKRFNKEFDELRPKMAKTPIKKVIGKRSPLESVSRLSPFASRPPPISSVSRPPPISSVSRPPPISSVSRLPPISSVRPQKPSQPTIVGRWESIDPNTKRATPYSEDIQQQLNNHFLSGRTDPAIINLFGTEYKVGKTPNSWRQVNARDRRRRRHVVPPKEILNLNIPATNF